MKFFHVYNEKYFDGLVKNGLINEDTGFKIQHAFSVPGELQFNRFAAKGTRLYELLREGKHPFYVDRIAGGITYYDYRFDPDLIRDYEELLGEWFLGFQLHESASNRRHDWNLTMERMNGEKGPYALEVLRERSWRDSAVTPDGRVLPGFSQGTPEEYAAMRYAETPDAFFFEVREMFGKYMRATDGHILPCDSFFLYTDLQNKLGMKSFMPEVGCQIPQMRIEIALARGIARAAGKTWGAYYETWIGNLEEGYSMPCFNREPGNEWYLTQQTHEDDFTSFGENGGSSRRLQKRIYYHALMSGADYFSEEWGLNCSYSDMNTFELSPYGKAKKEFIEDARHFKGVRAITPFAILLPRDYAIELPDVYDPWTVGAHRDVYLHCRLDRKEREYYGHVEDVLKLIYTRNGEIYGNESHVLTNSRFGDLFDILYEDADDAVLSRYDTLIDATPDGEIARARGEKHRILKSDSLEELENRLHQREKEILPVTVDGLHWLLSEDAEGKRYLSVFNNEGNERSIRHGDTVRREADGCVRITFCEPTERLRALKVTSPDVRIARVDACTYTLELPATELVILEY